MGSPHLKYRNSFPSMSSMSYSLRKKKPTLRENLNDTLHSLQLSFQLWQLVGCTLSVWLYLHILLTSMYIYICIHIINHISSYIIMYHHIPSYIIAYPPDLDRHIQEMLFKQFKQAISLDKTPYKQFWKWCWSTRSPESAGVSHAQEHRVVKWNSGDEQQSSMGYDRWP